MIPGHQRQGFRQGRRMLWGLLVLLGMALTVTGQESAPGPRPVVELRIEGAIGPATSDYFTRALAQAEKTHAAAMVILRIDTPGGLDAAMREIIQAILSAPMPVVAYVSPRGARAASAGTYILYASHIAAMAPATNLGAATPVRIGGMPGQPQPGERPQPQPGKEKPADTDPPPEQKAPPGADAMTKKAVNDAVAYIRGLAQMRGRNADWAEQAVREGVSLPANEALEQKVIDLVAANQHALREALAGREVQLGDRRITLPDASAPLVVIEPDWRSRLLATLTNPNVAYILMLLGIYGLFFEFANPGFVLPGVAGAISLLLALYAFQLLPINYAGLALVLLGIAFMVAEAFAPSFGALGIGGAIAFAIGSIILIDTEVAAFQLSLELVIALSATSFLFFLGVMGVVKRLRQQPVVSGQEEMLGAEGETLDALAPRGRVRVHSETWNGVSDQPIEPGTRVRVTGLDGLVVHVEPMEKE